MSQTPKNDAMSYAVELNQALSNCNFGIRSFENPIPEKHEIAATALLWLLEDEPKCYQVKHDENGYSFREKPRKVHTLINRVMKRDEEDQTAFSNYYTKLEDILSELSPIFAKRRTPSAHPLQQAVNSVAA